MTKKIYLLFVLVLFFAQQGKTQEWIVPEAQKTVENPSAYNLSNVQKGKDLYIKNCKSCHGDVGKHNGFAIGFHLRRILLQNKCRRILKANCSTRLHTDVVECHSLKPLFQKTTAGDW